MPIAQPIFEWLLLWAGSIGWIGFERFAITRPGLKKDFTVPANLPLPARNIVSILQSMLRLSRHEVLKLVHGGQVVVNGRVQLHSHGHLGIGDHVEVEFIRSPSIATPKAKKGKSESIEILYEDDDLMVVNKPSNLLTVPTPYRERHTLQSYLTKRIQREQRTGQAYCVHRLDRGVSGVLVFGKTLQAALALKDQFAARKPARRYIAIVHGSVEVDQGEIRSYLATDDQLNRYSVQDPTQGELAITHFRKTLELAHATMVQVRLETGRRNQIRVHMADLGHPILGDPRYGRDRVHPAWNSDRLALHAESLGFSHPVSGEKLEFKTDWPEEFRAFKRRASRS